MIHNIREAFTEILEDSDWMDDATKAVAKEKVSFNVSTESLLCPSAPSNMLSCNTRESPTYVMVHKFSFIHPFTLCMISFLCCLFHASHW